jgi:hypothetical protein
MPRVGTSAEVVTAAGIGIGRGLPASGEDLPRGDPPGRMTAGLSGRLLDDVAAQVAKEVGSLNGQGWVFWALHVGRWAGVAAILGIGCAFISMGVYGAYFGAAMLCDFATEARSRSDAHWLVGLLPALSRSFLIGGAVFATRVLCKRAGLLRDGASNGGGLTQQLLLGAGARDGAADRAGWLAIAGGNKEDWTQPTWTVAREARGLTQRQALPVAAIKLVFWHLSQPAAYLWLLGDYRCDIAELGPTQQYLAVVIAMRELLYLGSTVLAAVACPSFLLIDLRTVWNEAETPLERFTRIAMYVLCPHNFVAIVLSKRFPEWIRIFLCLAVVEVLADVSSCYALANLRASDFQQDIGSNSSAVAAACTLRLGSPDKFSAACSACSNEDECDDFAHHCVWSGDVSMTTGPLQVGYGITAFGFLFFFGPLSIASSFQGVLDRQRRKLLRVAKAVSGVLVLVAWVAIMVLMGWLLSGGNPFCSGLPLLEDPCSGHGAGSHGGCYGAAECHCEPEFGPDSKISGTSLCSCPIGFIDGEEGPCKHPTGCDRKPDCGSYGICKPHGGDYVCACESGWIGEICDHATGCDSDPCQHGGTCTPHGGQHTCACAEGFIGTSCETDCAAETKCGGSGTGAPTESGSDCECVYGPGFQNIDSHIINVTAAGLQFIEDTLPPDSQAKRWALCYDSRTDCTSCPSAMVSGHCSCTNVSQRTFHGSCDFHDEWLRGEGAETLVLGHNSLTYTFGGFAQASWGGHSWATGASGDFLFGLGPGAMATYRPRPGGGSTYQERQGAHWPHWGSGDASSSGDLVFAEYGVLGVGASGRTAHCDQGNTYEGVPNEVCGGSGNWGATEMEVWARR